MTTLRTLLFYFLFFISCSGNSQNRIIIHIPTAEAEAEYIWRNIQDINFFEANHYQLSLPKGQLIEELKMKARKGELQNEDYERLEVFVRDNVYQETDYVLGYEKIENQIILLNQMIEELSKNNWEWDFKEFDTYQINLTLYGPGGSYNPDEGSILIYTSPSGQFKNYENPANTIIHEIVHIGIEESIIGLYNIPHALKERIVDNIVFLSFREDLPNYKIQEMGDARIDAYLHTKEDIQYLEEHVKKIMDK